MNSHSFSKIQNLDLVIEVIELYQTFSKSILFFAKLFFYANFDDFDDFFNPQFPFIQNITNILLIFPNHSKNKNIYIDIYI